MTPEQEAAVDNLAESQSSVSTADLATAGERDTQPAVATPTADSAPPAATGPTADARSTETSAARWSKSASMSKPRARMTSWTSRSAREIEPDGSSTKRAWTLRHSAAYRSRSSGGSDRISIRSTRSCRAASSCSASRRSPVSSTARRYSGPKRLLSSWVRRLRLQA
jgi:hypothetical protein